MLRQQRRKSAGFTLLEVLVALSILAASYSVILQIFGGAAQKAALTGDYRRALIIAESQLTFAAATVTGRDFDNTGMADEKFQWQVSYMPTGEYSLPDLPARYTPVVVSVAVSWPDTAGTTRSVSISTIRLTLGQTF
jgi:type II secretion system protein I